MLAAHLGKPVGSATVADFEGYVAEQRAEGLSAATIARRTPPRAHLLPPPAADRRPRSDNPAAAVELPPRTRKLPRTLSPGEAERLIAAANGVTPRALRDRALVELLYGAGLRVSEAVGLEKGGVDLDDRLVRVTGKGGKERIVPVGRQAVEALRRYLARGRPYLDRRHRPELFLNAKGGALTRAGAFLILRRLAATPASSRAASTRTSCATRSRRTCSKAAPTCAASRRCSATPTSRRPSSTRTYPTGRRRELYFQAHPHARRRKGS